MSLGMRATCFLGQFSGRFLLLFIVFCDFGYYFIFCKRPKHVQVGLKFLKMFVFFAIF